MSTILFARARCAADTAHAASAADNGPALSVAVCDAAGRDILVERADGAAWFTSEIARAKARTAVLFGAETSALAALRERAPDIFAVAQSSASQPLTTLGGGLPVRQDTTVIGAVAVSGGSAGQDARYAEIARAAMTNDVQSDRDGKR
ncbi:MAG TPA: heme-binding protein [Pseudolysinimonas sp.]|nr:heme-binding protein [Pseudolysinimonas sp.]